MSTGAEPADLIDALTRMSSFVQGTLERCAAEHDISAPQARLLRALDGGRAPTMKELAELLGLDKSSTSGLVDRAQQRGLVRRVASQLDRRSVRVRLTGEGRDLAERLSALFGEEIAVILGPLSQHERAALATSMNRLLAQPSSSRARSV